MRCPCCGQDTLPDASLDGVADVAKGALATSLMRLLVEAYPRKVERNLIIETVWPYGAEPVNPRVNISVMLNRFRERLKPNGWTIRTDNGAIGLERLNG